MALYLDADYVQVHILRSMHDELRAHFEPKILASVNQPEVQALAVLTHRVVRLALAAETLSRNGFADQALLCTRAASECTINLLYIMYVGPAEKKAKLRKSHTALAQQFLAYADVEYWRGYKRRRDVARAAFRKRGLTETEIDTKEAELEKLYDNARALGGADARWHDLSLADMAERVRDNAPAFIEPQLAQPFYSNFMAQNSAVHGGPLSMRLHYRSLGCKPLEVLPEYDDTYANGIAMQATWCWRALADFFGEADVFQHCLAKHTEAVCEARTVNVEEA